MIVVRADKFRDVLVSEVRATYSEAKLEAMGKFMRDIIVKRTQAGIDADGNSFAPYSTKPAYISMRARPVPRGGLKTPQTLRKVRAYNKATTTSHQTHVTRKTSGRGGKSMFFPRGYWQYKANVGATHVNLMCTGRMLGAMSCDVSGKVIRIYFSGDEANTKAAGNDTRRDFFGVLRVPKEVERVKRYWQVLNGQ
jgi:hypothetical protein